MNSGSSVDRETPQLGTDIFVTDVNCWLPGIGDLGGFCEKLFLSVTPRTDIGADAVVQDVIDSLTHALSEDVSHVLICGDDSAQIDYANSVLGAVGVLKSLTPKSFSGRSALFRALNYVPTIKPPSKSIVLLCCEANSANGMPSFVYIKMKLGSSMDLCDDALARFPLTHLRVSARQGEWAEKLKSKHTFPAEAVSLIVTPYGTDPANFEVALKILDSTDVSLDEYRQLTGMPCPERVTRALASTSLVGDSQTLNDFVAFTSATLALHQKIIPRTTDDIMASVSAPVQKKQLPLGLKVETEARPWIHPVSPVETLEPRRVLVCSASGSAIVLEEPSQGLGTSYTSLIKRFDTEVFLFAAPDSERLVANLIQFRDFIQDRLQADERVELADVASALNAQLGLTPPEFTAKASIVASSLSDLLDKLNQLIQSISNFDQSETTLGASIAAETQRRARGVYSAHGAFNPERESGKGIAFLLPGLGAAYPDMLADLCFHFPEVRQVFDFVDRLALKSGDVIPPSTLIFPRASGRGSSTALLATMDSAVVTVILAEWALYRLLHQFGIKPDVLLGCSTGEFASLAMNDSIDIVEAAGTFYKLSTGVARSVSPQSLADMRSVCVAAEWSVLEPLAVRTSAPIYLGAEMGPKYSIVSGPRAAMDEFAAMMERNRIDFYPLPVAIPYHTPLVAGRVSTEQNEVQQLDMRAPAIPTWTCSDEALLPSDLNALRAWSVKLFEKPIRFRSTVRKMHDSGVRIFLEVGPKGALIPLLSQSLADKPHLGIAVNLPNRTGVSQLHHMLAALHCAGVHLDTTPLYSSRQILPLRPLSRLVSDWMSIDDSVDDPTDDLVSDSHAAFLDEPTAHSTGLPDVSPADFGLSVEEAADQSEADEIESCDDSDNVLSSFMGTLQEFHTRMLIAQELVMRNYLENPFHPDDHQNEPEEPGIHCGEVETTVGASRHQPGSGQLNQFDASADQITSENRFAFVADDKFDVQSSCFGLTLDLKKHKFLLDHAIGGSPRSGRQGRVYLVPLMVTLELLCEAASIFLPGNVVSAVRNVRAYKRVQVEETPLNLRVRIRSCDVQSGKVVAELIGDYKDAKNVTPEVESRAQELYVQADIYLSAHYGSDVSSINPPPDLAPSRFAGKKLYGAGSMFHGPLMQAVESMQTAPRCQVGSIRCKNYDGWFANGTPHSLLIDPLLLDNASQLVLYQMFEADLPATALLPFHIDSIEFYDSFEKHKGTSLKAQAKLYALNERGTHADIEICDRTGERLLARIESIHSRAIILPPAVRQYIENPAENYLSLPLNEFAAEGNAAVFRSLSSKDLDLDQTSLSWLGDYLLSSDDRQYSPPQRTGMERRQREWLLGRIVAKDAVRILLQRTYGIKVRAADITISRTDENAPVVVIPSLGPAIPVPQVSIAHSNEVAVAIAVPGHHDTPGIDIEKIEHRDSDFSEIAYTGRERELMRSLNEDINRSTTIFWAVKEAACKAGGTGLRKVDHIEIESVQLDSGTANAVDSRTGKRHKLRFSNSGEFIIAVVCS